MTVKVLYEQSIRPLSPADRYQLATMILGDIPPEAVIDDRQDWSPDDWQDFTRSSWTRFESTQGYSHPC
jgi:hypothetical protein